jgi:pyruvate formate lyase activating enzyme
LETAWQAFEYLHDNHLLVFLGIGIPYNKDLIRLEVIAEIGLKKVDVTRPSYWEMMQFYGILRDTGQETVICQTERGKIGPTGKLLH